MPLLVRSLPVIQNWDCHGCTDCCRDYTVRVTEEEKSRILAQGWEKRPELEGEPLFERDGFWSGRWKLHHRADGACVFLNPKGGCRIHAEFGSAAKPLACRMYPFVLVPAGDQWRVGLRFACPSAAGNKGKPLTEQTHDIRELAAALEAEHAVSFERLPTPQLRRGQTVPWSDLFEFVAAFRRILRETPTVERGLRLSLALSETCRKARFDKVTGSALREFLQILRKDADSSVPIAPELEEAPSRIGRLLFRQAAAIYIRKDVGKQSGISRFGRIALLWAALQFALGIGNVPRLHRLIPRVTFAKLEAPAPPLSAEAEELLRRYYLVKLESLQFFGPAHFGMYFWDGWAAFAMTYPIIRWLARAFHERPCVEAVEQAVRIVDDSFGFHPLLGTVRQQLAMRIATARGEPAKLIAWYARTR